MLFISFKQVVRKLLDVDADPADDNDEDVQDGDVVVDVDDKINEFDKLFNLSSFSDNAS